MTFRVLNSAFLPFYDLSLSTFFLKYERGIPSIDILSQSVWLVNHSKELGEEKKVEENPNKQKLVNAAPDKTSLIP